MANFSDILDDKRRKKPVKIPKGIPVKVLRDVKELRMIAVYCELKAVFYCGQWHNAKSRYQEIADFLQIGNSTLRLYLGRMKERGLINWNGKTLKLCSWTKFFDLYSLDHYGGSSFFYTENMGDTANVIRAFYLKDNVDKQQHTFWRKFFIAESYDSYLAGQLQSVIQNKANPQHKLETFERYANVIDRKLKSNRNYRRYFRRFCADPANLLKAFNNAKKCFMAGMDIPKNNPQFTLSCRGVATKLGKTAVSTGYYWERQLKAAGLIQITPVSIRSGGGAYNRQFWEGVQLGCYKRKLSKGGTSYFQQLSNQLSFLI